MPRPTIRDFNVNIKYYDGKPYLYYIDHLELKAKMGSELYAKYMEWSRGQTAIAEGDYPEDVDRFLQNLPPLD